MSKTEITQPVRPDTLLTSHQVGALLQVNPSSINNWVKDGRLHAFRTPGGHRRIRARDLVAFLQNHEMPIPRLLEDAMRRRVLWVDDDPKQLASLQRLLKPYTDRVDAVLVDNGVEALVKVGSFQPHVMVIDVFMPGIDGLEVCRRLKAHPDTSGIDLIVTSAQLTPEIEKKALGYGAKRCVEKPVSLEQVLEDIGLRQAA